MYLSKLMLHNFYFYVIFFMGDIGKQLNMVPETEIHLVNSEYFKMNEIY